MKVQLHKLRKRAGYLKWYVQDRAIPALPDRWRARRAEALRPLQVPRIDALPPVAWSGRRELEVVMLCGKSHLEMGIAASWSLLRYCPDWGLVVIGDGTLDDGCRERWGRVVPSLRMIFKHVSVAEVDRRLAGFDLLREFRRTYFHAAQLIDTHLVVRTPRLLVMDSDVLCMRRPAALIERAATGAREMAWNNDAFEAYCAPRAALEAELGCVLPSRLNSGLMLTPAFDLDDFGALQSIMEGIGRVLGGPDWMRTSWLSQTPYAAMTARFPGSSPLPDDYGVRTRRFRPKITVHYPSAPEIRPRFFTEGIPELLRQAGLGVW